MENVNNVKFEASVKKEAECGDCGHSWSSHEINCEDGCECFWFQPKKDVFKMQVIDLRSSVIVKVLINACDLEFDFLKTAISHTANSYHFDKNLADFRLDVTNSFNKNSDEKPVPRIECNQNFETRMFEYEMYFRDRMILLSEKEFYDLGRLIGHNVPIYKNGNNIPDSVESKSIDSIFTPNKLVSLLDMKKYHARHIQNLSAAWFQLINLDDKNSIIHAEVVLTDELVIKAKKALKDVEMHLRYLNLPQSLKYLDKIREKLDTGSLLFEDYEKDAEILSDRVDDELEDITFGFIPKDKIEFFENNELFGKEVFDKFPSTRQDIKDAGNCFCHGLYTASVFHLMRVAEVGAKTMVSAMKAEKHITTPVNVKGVKKMVKKPLELCDWGTLIKGMESALREMEQGTKISTKKKDNLAFFSHALGVFRNFKDAWRNNVAHSRKNYLEGETKDIMENTRQFMRHLTTRLEEKI